MIDFSKDLKASFSLLKRNKHLVIPSLLSLFIPFLLFYIFFSYSDITPVVKEIIQVKAQYDQERLNYFNNFENVNDSNYTLKLMEYLAKDNSNSGYMKDFGAKLEEKGLITKISSKLFNLKNLIFIIVIILFTISLSIYLCSMSYAMIACAMKKMKLTIKNVFDATNRNLPSLINLGFLVSVIMFVPIIIALAFGIFIAMWMPIVGALLIVLFMVLFLVFIFYVVFKLIFSVYPIYLDNQGAVQGMKISFRLTKGRFKQVLIVFLIIYAINLFISAYVSSPISSFAVNLLFGENMFIRAFDIILLSLFALIQSIIITFENIFAFYAYIDFKKQKK